MKEKRKKARLFEWAQIICGALACIALQSNQNDQHGGQSIPNFDYGMAEGVAKTYRKAFASCLQTVVEDVFDFKDESAPAHEFSSSAATIAERSLPSSGRRTNIL